MPGLFKCNKAIKIRDTYTGKVYTSKYQAGKALAYEFGIDSSDRLAWYTILHRAESGRFVEVKTGKPIVKYW